jgi:hypothetical protein
LKHIPTCPGAGATINRNESFDSLKIKQKQFDVQDDIWAAIDHGIEFFNRHQERKDTQEANIEPIKMSLEALFQFALNIEELAVNPGRDYEGNARSSKKTKTETTVPRKQGGGKGNSNQKRSGGKSSILKGQDGPSCNFCGIQGHAEPACRMKAKAMATAKKYTIDRNALWKKEKAEQLNIFL